MRILIIKLGALGDVLRTTPLLAGFKSKYPGCLISWLVEEKNLPILENNHYVDELLYPSHKNLRHLQASTFDLAINLDKEPEALDALMSVTAKKKLGFGLDKNGKLCAIDSMSDYACRLGIDDELKFRKNQKTYQTISFEQAGLRFEGQEYLFLPTPRDVEIASKHLKKIGADPGAVARPVIGINTGSGVKFAGKRLEEAAYVRLAAMLGERLGATIFLLGGQDEIQRNHSIQRQIAGKAFDTGSHTIGQFAGIVSFCDLVITGDTTAMHVAIALKVPTVVCFGSTCAAEIELYGRGFKIVSKLACAPCYKKACPIGEACMAQTDLGLIAAAAEQLLNRPRK